MFTKNKSNNGEISGCYSGSTLESLKKEDGTNIPKIIYHITDRVEEHLQLESLYRKPGNKEKIMKLQKKNPDKPIKDSGMEIHDWTSWLKTLLVELKEPLLPKIIFENYKRQENIDPELRKQNTIDSLERLDPVRKETLQHLMYHFINVISNVAENKMDKKNMSVVWAPVLFYPLLNSNEAEQSIEFLELIIDIYIEALRDQDDEEEDNRFVAEAQNVVEDEEIHFREEDDATDDDVPAYNQGVAGDNIEVRQRQNREETIATTAQNDGALNRTSEDSLYSTIMNERPRSHGALNRASQDSLYSTITNERPSSHGALNRTSQDSLYSTMTGARHSRGALRRISEDSLDTAVVSANARPSYDQSQSQSTPNAKQYVETKKNVRGTKPTSPSDVEARIAANVLGAIDIFLQIGRRNRGKKLAKQNKPSENYNPNGGYSTTI